MIKIVVHSVQALCEYEYTSNGNSSYDGMSDYAAKVSKIEALKKALRQQNSPRGYGSRTSHFSFWIILTT
jgi:hypothetical protein